MSFSGLPGFKKTRLITIASITLTIGVILGLSFIGGIHLYDVYSRPLPPTPQDQREWMSAENNHFCTKKQAKAMWRDYWRCTLDSRLKPEYCRGISIVYNCDKKDM